VQVSKDILDWLSLAALPGIGCATIHRLLDIFGSPGAVLQAGKAVGGTGVVRDRAVALFTDSSALDHARCRAEQELTRARQLNIHLLACSDPRFPPQLREIRDCPVLLYLRGNPDLFERPMVAVIGSRAATAYGRRVSARLGAELAGHGIAVVSGLAAGIDSCAHGGCLDAGGATIGVLGCGVDVVYPRSNASLYEQMTEQGLLISEYPLGTRPEGFRFPARNRIISGLAKAVVVVEATRKSGSLITTRLALDQGRDVFAVPGRIDSAKSEGTHRLIQQGAHLVQSAGDILEELQLDGLFSHGRIAPGREKEKMDPDISEQEQQLLNAVDVYPANIDDLAVKTGMTTALLHDLLLHLELKGLVRQLPGQQYERVC
jgi:DNA processing protein